MTSSPQRRGRDMRAQRHLKAALASSTLAAAALLASSSSAQAADQDEVPHAQRHVTMHQDRAKGEERAGRGSPAVRGADRSRRSAAQQPELRDEDSTPPPAALEQVGDPVEDGEKSASRRTPEETSRQQSGAGQDPAERPTANSSPRQRTGAEQPGVTDRKSGRVQPTARTAPASDAAAVSLRRQRAGGPVAPGETFEYTIAVTNHGPSVAKDVKVRDELPAPLEFVSSKDGCTAQGQVVTCTPRAELGVGEKASWVITVRLDPDYAGDGSDIANVAEVESATKDPNDGNDTGPTGGSGLPEGGRPASPAADVAITKVAKSDKPVSPGTTFDYEITVTNQGPSTAKGIAVTDTLPKALAFVSSAEGCTGDKGAYGSTVTCPELPELKPGEKKTFTVTVRLSPSYDGDGTDVVNTAQVTAKTADPKPDNNSATASGLPGQTGSAPVPAEADLAVRAQDITGTVVPGTVARGQVTVINHGPSTTRQQAMVDITLPAHVTVRGTGVPAGCTVRNGGKTLHCTIEAGLEAAPATGGRASGSAARRKADSSVTLSYPVQVDADAPLSTTLTGGKVTVSSPEDSNADNNTDTFMVTTAAQGSADLATTKTAILPPGQSTVGPGDTLTYLVKVTNNGPSDAENVKVTDRLPDGLLFKRGTTGCTASGQTVTCQAGRLAAGRSVEFDIVVRLSPAYQGTGKDLDNIAAASSTTPDPNPGNDQNPPGTSGPGGGPLIITTEPPALDENDNDENPPGTSVPGSTPTDTPRPPALAQTGDDAPQWTLWATGLLLAGGAGLMYAARRRTS
ncbi:DUF11 domain-containing protein [Streptomyces sp. TRM66268-LWL]|uniref:DUF11 domain-containing protein n=1 Tax=Streptomyces polyasparticus TaxID=2767826 RepID=A0ABR7SCL2_9ACTN|nr:DUF11 domain-containing protein [Streptomyces polyasparticus]MBC9712739.1 DUF11 domain-containing protein [Streptomyces polyasparticus]